MREHSRCTILVSLSWLLCAGSARAQGSPDTSELEALLGESVVTTASRSAERASVAPAAVFTITAAEIAQCGARTVDEALELFGQGLYVAAPRDYSTGIDVGAQGILLRDGGRHVLVMLDGVILNSQGTGRVSINEALGVPLDFIDHIEVMLGPGSVVYGSNAMLAVINVVSKGARELSGVFVGAEVGVAAPQAEDGALRSAGTTARAGLRYRLSLGGGARFKLGHHDGEFAAMVDWIQDLSATYGVTPFSMGYPANQSSLPGQATWGGLTQHELRAPSAALTLRLGEFRLLFNASSYQRGMPLVGTFSDPGARENQGAVRVDLSHSRVLRRRFTLDSRLYGGYSSREERSNYGESFWCLPDQDGCHFSVAARSGGLGLEQRVSADWFLDGKLLSMLGYDVRARFFDSDPASYTDLRTDQPSTVVPIPHASSTTVFGSLFAQQVWNPLRWLSLNVGARLDLQSQYGARLSPRAAAVFTPHPTTVLRVTYSSAFRGPSSFELTEFDPTYRITPQALRAETMSNIEAEAQQRVWRFQLALRGYASFYDDMVESRVATADEIARFAGQLSPSVDPSVVVVNDNLTALQVFGGSGSVQAKLPWRLWLGLNVHGAYARQSDGERYERMPTYFGNFRAGWSSADDGYAVTLTGVYADERRVLLNATPTDYRLGPRLDLRLTGSGPVGRIQGLRWRASVGFMVNPFLPYAVTVNTDTPGGYVLYPAAPRLSGFIGVTYRLGGPAGTDG